MTLVIAAPGTNFILLGADSRAVIQDVAGNRVQINTVKKLIHVSKYVAMLVYGESEVAVQLLEKYKLNMEADIEGASDVAESFAEFCGEEFKKVMWVPKAGLPIFGFLVAGLNKGGGEYKIPCIYNIISTNGFMPGICRPFAIKGKPIIALYNFAKKYDENMSVEEISYLVAQSIYDTIEIDGDVGGKIRMAIITPKIGFREISDVEKYIERWEIGRLRKIMEET